jgi:Fic family protein
MRFETVDQKRKLLDQKRPLPSSTLASLKEHLLLEWTYHSNAIEGNTLTLSETKVVLEGITVGGKTLREHLEVVNHREAIHYVEEVVSRRESFSEWQLKNIHCLILKGIDDENAGVYRKQNVIISGANHIPPNTVQVPGEMEKLLAWYSTEAQVLHPVEKAALLHTKFVKIHPFIDGNGRTARLLMNLELMKDGYVPVVIRKENRARYYDALDKAHTKEEYDDFLELVTEELNRSFDLYLRVIL